MKVLQESKKIYDRIEIPEELSQVVEDSIQRMEEQRKAGRQADNKKQDENSRRRNGSDHIACSDKPGAKLINDQRDRIGKHTHITNRSKGPLGIVHLTPDRAHRSKTRSA